VPLITTITAQSEEFKHYLELQGSVSTKQNLVIYPEMSGILTRVYVKEGQKVSKGQLLAKIDDGGLSQQVAQLQIQADLAKTTFERQKRLWDQKIGSEIDDVITEQGSVVAPGQSQLMRIVNLDDMYIETDVPERYITNVTKGKDVLVEFPVLGKNLNAKIRQTGNFVNPDNRTFKVEIAVPNKDKSIKPNLTARLKINDYTNEKAILIPQSIISENAEGKQYVYVLADKNNDKATAKQTIIETGKTQGDVIEVLKGITDNAEIIDEGARSVKDGQTVKVTKDRD